MGKWKLEVSYDGSNFAGYQIQPNKRTVQEEIEKVLTRMHKGEYTKVIASGRTDARVHAVGQVIHFTSQLNISEFAWKKALNSQLPDDIFAVKCEKVEEDFHARYGAKEKEYRYVLYTGEDFPPFYRNYKMHVPYKLNVEAMKEALHFLEGTHDFSSFCAANTSVVDKVRTIFEAELLVEENEVIIRLKGNGFLYNMVRIIVGTLIEIGLEKKKSVDMKTIIEAKNRAVAGKTAPPEGLYLWRVDYNN